MTDPVANVTFSEFYNDIEGIYKTLRYADQKEFKKRIAIYYVGRKMPKDWRNVFEQSETLINWEADSDFSELRRGNGHRRRAIALYYYLQSLTHDLSFAKAVDGVVFKAWPENQRTYQLARGQPVFLLAEVLPPADDESWKSALQRWEMVCKKNAPANGYLASMSIECGQAGDTRNPVALFAEVQVRPAFELETGIELRFAAVHIDVKCDNRFPSEVHYVLSKSCDIADGQLQLDGTATFRYVTLSNISAGLDGNYVSDTLVTFHPNCKSSEFNAALRTKILSTNVIFPPELGLLPKEKMEIVKRMVAKAVLPSPDSAGLITLHELAYNVSAIEQ